MRNKSVPCILSVALLLSVLMAPLASADIGDDTQASILADFDSGDLSYTEAWDALKGIRECTEDDIEDVENHPCKIVEMHIGDASTIDPHDAYDSASGDVIEQVYDTLYRYAGDGTGNAIIEARLATGFSVSEDGLTYTFTLRDDVYFSNGDKMDASDVVYSWCRVLGYGSPDSHVGWILEQSFDCNDADGNHDDMGGLSFSVISDTSFSVILFAPSSAFISTIAYTVGAVINADLCEANRVDAGGENDDYCHEWMDEGPMGAGTNAYTVQTWVREDRLVLVPNWMYWEERAFNLNMITSLIVSDGSVRFGAFDHSGSNGPQYDYEADLSGVGGDDLTAFCYIDNNGNGEFDEGEDDDLDDKPNVRGKDGYICTYRETFTTTLSAFNLHPKALDPGEDSSNTGANSSLILNHDCSGDGTNDCSVMEVGAVRAAISYAFDYETHRRDTYDNSLAPQYGPIPTGFLYDWTQYEVFTYDLTHSESLLEDAGFIRQYDCAELANNNTVVVDEDDRDGTECRLPQILRVMANEGNDYRIAMAGQLQESLGTIGVATAGDAKPWAEYLTMYYTRTWDIRFSGWAPDYLDPDNYWSPFAGGNSIGGDAYGTGYENADVNAALLIGRTSQDDAEREQAYIDAFEAWILDPNMIIIGQYNGVGVKHDDICSPDWVAIGSAHWFDYDKIPVVDDVLKEAGCEDDPENDDDDGDTVLDNDDDCPLGNTGWTSRSDTDHDSDGCQDSDEDTDDDNDSVMDVNDDCPTGDLGWTSSPLTDFDSDGCQDLNEDTDDDNDGYLDTDDWAPLDSSEWIDTDDDGIGDNADQDDDNDGYLDTDDWAPLDSSEWVDSDGDGQGNNADPDDDDDGWVDMKEGDCGTDPLDASSQPGDLDGDSLCDAVDTDDDGDYWADSVDAFPRDSSEWFDTDGDGIGDNADEDDDGDGWTDVAEDTCDGERLDATITPTDSDGDGICDGMDPDRDGDGTLNDVDAFPDDATEDTDTDGDGLGNNADLDDDGDGLLDVDEAAAGTDPLDQDSDDDGRADGFDAFPLDAGEWKDSDGDGVGDNGDAYPNFGPWQTTGDMMLTLIVSILIIGLLGGGVFVMTRGKKGSGDGGLAADHTAAVSEDPIPPPPPGIDIPSESQKVSSWEGLPTVGEYIQTEPMQYIDEEGEIWVRQQDDSWVRQ